MTEATVVVTETSARTPVYAEVAAPAVEIPAAPVATPVAEAAPVVAPAIEVTEVAVAQVVEKPAAVAVPSVPSTVALEAIGLQMVETSPEKRAAVAATPTEKPVRKPRTPRAKPVVVDEPLQMVETRKE